MAEIPEAVEIEKLDHTRMRGRVRSNFAHHGIQLDAVALKNQAKLKFPAVTMGVNDRGGGELALVIESTEDPRRDLTELVDEVVDWLLREANRLAPAPLRRKAPQPMATT